LKVGILQADAVLPQFQAQFGNYPDMFQTLLSGAATGPIEFAVYDVEHLQYPKTLDECDGYVITGSKKSVYDDEPWIHRLRQFVLDLHQAKIRLVGICFGHQIVATALGGDTQPAAVGWGVGIHRSELVASKEFMQPPLDSIAAIVSHKDQVTRLPEGAELLAGSEFCPNAMYQVQDHILTFQGHPEFCKSYSKALMDMRQDILGSEKYQAGVSSLTQPMHAETLAQWIVRFLDSDR